MLPDAVPLLCGVNVRETETVSPAAIVFGSDSPPRRNSVLVDVAEEIVKLDPCAVRVVLTVLLVPTATFPKFSVVKLEVNRAVETPLPDKAISSFEFEASETTSIVPVMLPSPKGVHKTLKVTLWPRSSFRGRVKPLTPKPGPVTLACEIVTVEYAEFVSVSNWV